MLKKLQAKWKVNGWRLLLIITTFAVGGSLCGFAGRQILLLTGLEKNLVWFLLYILLVILLWPLCVLLISIPLGQFTFFKKYILRMASAMKPGSKHTIAAVSVTRVAIFASGAGSNAKKIIEHFSNDPVVKIGLIVSNKPQAGVLQIAHDYHIESIIINKEFKAGYENLAEELIKRKIDLIILAGFLLKIPSALVQAFPKKIINIHPALLPAYGGKGLYGMHVHEAVISNKEKQSGISIHYVDEVYDHGEIIFQSACDIAPGDTAAILAQKIHLLEHTFYPTVIDQLIKKQKAS